MSSEMPQKPTADGFTVVCFRPQSLAVVVLRIFDLDAKSAAKQAISKERDLAVVEVFPGFLYGKLESTYCITRRDQL